MAAVTPKLHFQSPELARRFEVVASNSGVDRLPAEVELLKSALARFGTVDASGEVTITKDDFERFTQTRMAYERRLESGLASYAKEHPFKYVVGNLWHETVEGLTFGALEGGEEFRREVANFSYDQLGNFIDQK